MLEVGANAKAETEAAERARAWYESKEEEIYKTMHLAMGICVLCLFC